MQNTKKQTLLRQMIFLIILILSALSSCQCIDETLRGVRGSLAITPSEISKEAVPVGEDSSLVIELKNTSTVASFLTQVSLSESGDPAFKIFSLPPEASDRNETFPSIAKNETKKIIIKVHPLLNGEIKTELNITVDENTDIVGQTSKSITIPITISAENFGLAKIRIAPEAIEFDRVGEGDLVRTKVDIFNEGTRDLILYKTELIREDMDDLSIKLTLGVQDNWSVAPGESVSAELLFQPNDVAEHNAKLHISSNDPQSPLLKVPVHGAGSLCPTAALELLEDIEKIQPLDTLRFDGGLSAAVTPDENIVMYQWRIEQRPLGSTATFTFAEQQRSELVVDLAGDYQVRLSVQDSTGAHSCEDAVLRFRAQSDQDLLFQLVWDHPRADLDLHLIRDGGEMFNHSGDTYFSNKTPNWFPETPDSNPILNADDDEGYGPENITIKHPIPGSRWRVLIHYWNKQSDGDPFTQANLRVFAHGQQILDLSQAFENDQMLWQAIEIIWPENDLEMAEIVQIGLTEEYIRPF